MNTSLHYFIMRACDLYSHILRWCAINENVNPVGSQIFVYNLSRGYSLWYFSCNYGSKAAGGCQMVEMWSGANLYISILIPKGTIRKCDKNNYWRLVLRGTPMNLIFFFWIFFPSWLLTMAHLHLNLECIIDTYICMVTFHFFLFCMSQFMYTITDKYHSTVVHNLTSFVINTFSYETQWIDFLVLI